MFFSLFVSLFVCLFIIFFVLLSLLVLYCIPMVFVFVVFCFVCIRILVYLINDVVHFQSLLFFMDVLMWLRFVWSPVIYKPTTIKANDFKTKQT